VADRAVLEAWRRRMHPAAMRNPVREAPRAGEGHREQREAVAELTPLRTATAVVRGCGTTVGTQTHQPRTY
jgi:hypothetical protein